MSIAALYYAALCQTAMPNPACRSELRRNTERMLGMMDAAVRGYAPFHDVRLVVFPEFAHAAPIFATAAELHEKLAIHADDEEISLIRRKARELGCYVQTGSFLEKDDRYPDCVFNTTLLISPDGEVLSRYRKVNTWIPWETHTSPHDIENYADELFPVVDTEIGRLGVATCYDWLFPEVTRELALGGAEILIRISAYMDPWGSTEPTEWWPLVNRVRAIENTACVLACNQGASLAQYPPFSWPGGSMAVDHDGRILAQATPGPGERIVVAPVALATLRAERERRVGHAMLAHLRTEAYPRARRPVLERGAEIDSRETGGNATRIARARPRSGLDGREAEGRKP